MKIKNITIYQTNGEFPELCGSSPIPASTPGGCRLANSAYWAYWLGHMDQWQFRDDIYYCYVDVPGDCFKDQAQSQSKYIPRMPKDITTIHTIRPIKSK